MASLAIRTGGQRGREVGVPLPEGSLHGEAVEEPSSSILTLEGMLNPGLGCERMQSIAMVAGTGAILDAGLANGELLARERNRHDNSALLLRGAMGAA